MTTVNDLCDSIELDGFAIVERVFDVEKIEELKKFTEAEIAIFSGNGGVRNLLEFSQMRELANCAALQDVVQPVLGADAKVVRGILFDKTGDANWKVPWHQDVTIAVSQKVESDGYGPWSVKAGVLHVQPPAEILERMISVRFHLDDCPEENGALRVIAGSHRSGKLPASLPEEYFKKQTAVVCEAKSGAVLLMRPLLLHASSAAMVPAHRRVIHFEYAAAELPAGIGWAADQA